MDIKGLTSQLLGKTQTDTTAIKASVAASDHAPYSSNLLSPQTLKALQAMLQSLQLGKVFDVIVTRVEGDLVTLQIPGSPADAPVLQAEMKSPPPIGTRLTLQLTDEANKPELKIIATPNSPQDAVSRNLRLSLQQQKPLTPLLANLALLSKAAARSPADLPEEVVATARQVVQQFSHALQIKSPAGLKQAMQQSGPYLEATLARQPLPAGSKATATMPYLPAATTGDNKQPEQATSKAAKQARLEMLVQTIQTISRAMQQQPLQDVRANLLRLASVIRAAAEQQALQPSPTEAPDEPAEHLLASGGRPVSPPPATVLTDDPKSSAPTPSPTTSAPGKPDVAAQQTASGTPTSPQGQTAIRSQTPHPQPATEASLANIFHQKTALDELLGQVEGALSRIHVQQLQTAATDQQQRPVWVMELPVRTDQGIDLFDMRIQRDSENHAPGDPRAPWTVSLAFDLEKLGAIRAQVTLYGEDRVGTVFWAEQQETSTYFNQHLDKLARRFQQVGLEVARLDCRCGKPDAPPPSQEPRLVDEKV